MPVAGAKGKQRATSNAVADRLAGRRAEQGPHLWCAVHRPHDRAPRGVQGDEGDQTLGRFLRGPQLLLHIQPAGHLEQAVAHLGDHLVHVVLLESTEILGLVQSDSVHLTTLGR